MNDDTASSLLLFIAVCNSVAMIYHPTVISLQINVKDCTNDLRILCKRMLHHPLTANAAILLSSGLQLMEVINKLQISNS